ncbi:cell cycle transcriptional regulator TrcR [Candidatus Cytomitobacter primus]|uniref:DUF1013 domain-containing protein n=1 Tax=Candidatus Cytomitobacter primus TaxID=2066024 RepID=A0A5C0UEJ0_9PROT|nr:cell cycle transcriptional regulator TrcR [Candidatus Cytomitobacter primus]QEK38468.1 DUF1013 domain-containing protein [Candidatus Cytomitobacter primus]
MNRLLMPRSTALWLLKNTALSLKQISGFCSISVLDLDAMKKGFSDTSLQESDPVERGQLLQEEIDLCEQDSDRSLLLNIVVDVQNKIGKIPYGLKKYLPKCVVWMHQNREELTNKNIAKFFGMKEKEVRETIENITKHSDSTNPVLMGICSQEYMDSFIKNAIEQNENDVKKGKKKSSV